MSIRYECEECGSILKIKDDLAGKPGKCPKCKTPFLVPAADADGDSASSGEITARDSDSSNDAKPKLASSPPSQSGANFDLDAFLSADDESDGKALAKRSKSQPDTDEEGELFQIRRGPDVPEKQFLSQVWTTSLASSRIPRGARQERIPTPLPPTSPVTCCQSLPRRGRKRTGPKPNLRKRRTNPNSTGRACGTRRVPNCCRFWVAVSFSIC